MAAIDGGGGGGGGWGIRKPVIAQLSDGHQSKRNSEGGAWGAERREEGRRREGAQSAAPVRHTAVEHSCPATVRPRGPATRSKTLLRTRCSVHVTPTPALETPRAPCRPGITRGGHPPGPGVRGCVCRGCARENSRTSIGRPSWTHSSYLKEEQTTLSPILQSKLAGEVRNTSKTRFENGHQLMPWASIDAHGRIDTRRRLNASKKRILYRLGASIAGRHAAATLFGIHGRPGAHRRESSNALATPCLNPTLGNNN